MFYTDIYIENLLDKKHKVSNFNKWYVVLPSGALPNLFKFLVLWSQMAPSCQTHSSRDLKLSVNVNNWETYGYLKHTYVIVSHNPLMQLAKQ